jgi:hypothetical protein
MPLIPFTDLPAHGRLWVFPVAKALDEAEQARCLEVVDAFLDQWAAHGHPLASGRELREGRFVLVGVDVDAEAPSGCSIDALINALRHLGSEMHTTFIDHLRHLGSEMHTTFIDHAPVWYRDGRVIRCVSRADFRRRADEGEVTLDTRVFDTSLTSVAQLREGQLERAVADSWHGRAFFRDQVGA